MLKKENLSLKEEPKYRQDIIQSILNQNAEHLKLNNSYINKSISQYIENESRNNEKKQKIQAVKYLKSLILNRFNEKILKMTKKKKLSQVKREKRRKEDYLYRCLLHGKKRNSLRDVQG